MDVVTEIESNFIDFLLQLEIVDQEIFANLKELPIGDIEGYLVKNNIITRNILNSLKVIYKKTIIIDINKFKCDTTLASLLPENIIRQYKAVALARDKGQLVVGMLNPTDISAIEYIESAAGEIVMPVMLKEDDFESYVNVNHTKNKAIEAQAKDISSEIIKDIPINIEDSAALNPNQPVNQLLENILTQAVRMNTSDIHIESTGSILRIRYRVNGKLQEQTINSPKVGDMLLRRLKVLSQLDITQEIAPQDGSFTIKLDGMMYSMRLSILATYDGFSSVLRASKNEVENFNLHKYVKDEGLINAVQKFLLKNEAMMLVTGPTGSGKTTTLYSTLMEANEPTEKIISIEDPVEIPLDRISQVQVRADVGLSFSDALRSVLRQDPDIIMLGEIRDEITANIALKAAITGHKVLATLHTKSVINTVDRLLNLGLDPFMIGAALNLVVSQRLVRKVCDKCATNYVPEDFDREMLKQYNASLNIDDFEFKYGLGCSSCNNSGYSGRTSLYEYLEFNRELIHTITINDINQFYEVAGNELKGRRLADNAFKAAIAGEITYKDFCTQMTS